jgi:hypothetical protein
MIFKLIQCGIPYQHPTGALKSFIRAAQRATFYSGSEVIGWYGMPHWMSLNIIEILLQ